MSTTNGARPSRPPRATSPGIGVIGWSLARADLDQRLRNLWLRTLDRLGPGFDS
ncbi:hypothetical protein OG778_30250 [Streptomyces sp. NBC_00184]|uniref:hypothetical protein n=1 Tax=Streptomyces sp. NBC_00184 TaxID=2975673 RepID=UPI002E2A4816|nr:hypothetical protein [Streptomyces sp. NBC_00184]